LVWDLLKSKLGWVWPKWVIPLGYFSGMGIPISLLFWYATKIGYEGFGNLWAVRFMGFATSMLTFPVMTWLYLGETITLKTLVTILLAFIIMLLQLL